MSVLDGLAVFLEDSGSLSELERYLNEVCLRVPNTGDEQTHESYLLYKEYESRVRRILTDFIDESRCNFSMVGIGAAASVESILNDLSNERAERRRDLPGRLFQVLLVITSFEEFVAAARQQRSCIEAAIAATTVSVGYRIPTVAEAGAGLRYDVPMPSGYRAG
mmetsp:Transcript_121865/g.191263  ORF Transcript_121865/g.191263 Transcript_121865/m.191263 type:complete len:164 (+) Transcript_121865:85-576(+)